MNIYITNSKIKNRILEILKMNPDFPELDFYGATSCCYFPTVTIGGKEVDCDLDVDLLPNKVVLKLEVGLDTHKIEIPYSELASE